MGGLCQDLFAQCSELHKIKFYNIYKFQTHVRNSAIPWVLRLSILSDLAGLALLG
jgi:hypothetical protein